MLTLVCMLLDTKTEYSLGVLFNRMFRFQHVVTISLTVLKPHPVVQEMLHSQIPTMSCSILKFCALSYFFQYCTILLHHAGFFRPRIQIIGTHRFVAAYKMPQNTTTLSSVLVLPMRNDQAITDGF